MANASPDQESALEWRIDVSLLGQPTMVANFVKVIVIAGGVMGAPAGVPGADAGKSRRDHRPASS